MRALVHADTNNKHVCMPTCSTSTHPRTRVLVHADTNNKHVRVPTCSKNDTCSKNNKHVCMPTCTVLGQAAPGLIALPPAARNSLIVAAAAPLPYYALSPTEVSTLQALCLAVFGRVCGPAMPLHRITSPLSIHTHTQTKKRTQKHTHKYLNTHIYTHTLKCAHTHTHIHTHTHKQFNTHVHTHKNTLR